MKQTTIIAIAIAATLVAGFAIFRQNGNSKPTPVPSDIKQIYNQWKAQYNLKIGASEDDLRLKVFANNYELITKHNENTQSKYKLGLNPYAHLTVSEFSALKLGYARSEIKTVSVNASEPVNATNFTAPDALDWDAQSKVSKVKNQGHCGSCWAFSASGAIESLFAITTGTVTEFSEQQLVDCSTSYGNNGCNGGEMFLAFKYVADKGIVSEADYPYTAVDGTCNIPAAAPTFRLSGYRNVTANSSAALKAAVAKNPVSVSIQADTSEFQLYKSGILTGDACGTTLDHGVLAVGYGNLNGTDFWKVKNSWGPEWGANGFILIERREGPGTCGINQENAYPTHYC